jgi:PhzF family phenazine biosynthesis protein
MDDRQPHPAPMARRFRQVDVFTSRAYCGNPLAVVLDGAGLSTHDMERFARWTNLSETTFLLPPEQREADYRVRIFTSAAKSAATGESAYELPFAGHPTLGSCHAWLEAGGTPQHDSIIVQECPAGLVAVRPMDHGLAFAAPPLVRSGAVEEALLERIAAVLHLKRSEILDAAWADNGPGCVAILLGSADAELTLQPGAVDKEIGVIGPYPAGSPCAFEVRAFFPKDGATAEDPATGSLHASLAQWLLRTGRAKPPYVASQGTARGRSGRIHVTHDPEGSIWVGGGTVTCISGDVHL